MGWQSCYYDSMNLCVQIAITSISPLMGLISFELQVFRDFQEAMLLFVFEPRVWRLESDGF